MDKISLAKKTLDPRRLAIVYNVLPWIADNGSKQIMFQVAITTEFVSTFLIIFLSCIFRLLYLIA